MVPKTQSAKTPVAGPPTTVVRKPFANTPCNNAPPGSPTWSGRATLLPAWPLNGTCVSHKSPLFRSGIYPNETNETHYRYGECVFSYDECPICTLSRYDSGLVTETKARHQVSPHTQPSIPMPGQADRIQRRHKCTRISYENVNSCVNPLSKAKLSRSKSRCNKIYAVYNGYSIGNKREMQKTSIGTPQTPQNADVEGQ